MPGEIEYSGSSPSFNCYSSDSTTSTAIAKVIREEYAAAPFHQDEEFEFGLVLNDEASLKEIDLPGFSRNSKDHEIDASSSITAAFEKLLIVQPEESSSEADELEYLPYGTFCVWRPQLITKCKKSRSTGSGSKRWSIRYLLRRSNSEGKEPMVLVTPKKVDGAKQRRNSGEVLKVGGRWNARTPVLEQFYVQRRAENEVGKRKSYLPYKKDLVGLFAIANANGMGKMLPF